MIIVDEIRMAAFENKYIPSLGLNQYIQTVCNDYEILLYSLLYRNWF